MKGQYLCSFIFVGFLAVVVIVCLFLFLTYISQATEAAEGPRIVRGEVTSMNPFPKKGYYMMYFKDGESLPICGDPDPKTPEEVCMNIKYIHRGFNSCYEIIEYC